MGFAFVGFEDRSLGGFMGLVGIGVWGLSLDFSV
jgi:hypothetical protein